MDKANHIRILLDRSGFTKVGQLRTFSFSSLTAFHTTVQLRKCDNRDIQFLRQPFQRTGDGTYLLLTATETHTTCIHQLKVVDDNTSYPMFTYQTACLCTQLEHRKTRRIIHINRSIIQFLNLEVKLLPLIAFQASAFNLLTRYLTYIHDQTVYQLNVTHFKREQGNRHIMVHRHILRHRKYKRRLTHRRTGSDNDQVRILPPRSDLIQRIETGTRTAQTFFLVCRFLQHIHRILDNRIDLGHVFLYVPLRNLKQFTFGLLHQVFHVDRLIKRLSLYHGRKRD